MEPENKAEQNRINLYLWESEEWDCGVNYLDLIVSFSDNYTYSSEERVSTSIRETKKIPLSELEKALEAESEFSTYLLNVFGIANLRPGPGLPKGPFVHVDENATRDARNILNSQRAKK